jgi:outer membrane protein assembly factor BamB
MLGPVAVIGCCVGNPGGTNACVACGHANPAGSARWCGACGAQLPAPGGPSPGGVSKTSGPPPDRASGTGDEDPGTSGVRWLVSSPRHLAVPALLLTVVVGAVVLTTERDGIEAPATIADDDVELPEADALAPSGDTGPSDPPAERPGPVRDIAPGAVVWSDRVTAEPLASTSDLEVADGLIVTAERSPEETEDEIAADVLAVDAMTGEQVWKRTVMAPRFPATAPGVGVADRWAILADCAQLTGLDLADGTVVWQHRTDRVILLNDVAAAPRDDPEVVLVVTSNRTAPRLDWVVTAVDVVTGEVRWDREVVRAAVTPDGAVVLDEDGRVTGLAAATGEPMWEITPETAPEELWSVAGAILETDDRERARGRLRGAADGRLLLDGEVRHHGPPMPGRNEVERRSEVVTTAAEVALVEDGQVSWTVPQPDAPCCVSSHVPAEGPVTALLTDGTLLRLDRDDGVVRLERAGLYREEPNTTLVGRFVLAADEPIRDRANSLRLLDTSAPTGWRVVATHPEGQVVAVLPEGDVLLLADDELNRLTSP